MIVRYWNCLLRGYEATKDDIHMQIRWFHFKQNKIFVKQIQETRFRGRKSIKKKLWRLYFLHHFALLDRIEKIRIFQSHNLGFIYFFLANLGYLRYDIMVAWNLVGKPKMTNWRHCTLGRYHFLFYCLVTFIPCSTWVV